VMGARRLMRGSRGGGGGGGAAGGEQERAGGSSGGGGSSSGVPSAASLAMWSLRHDSEQMARRLRSVERGVQEQQATMLRVEAKLDVLARFMDYLLEEHAWELAPGGSVGSLTPTLEEEEEDDGLTLEPPLPSTLAERRAAQQQLQQEQQLLHRPHARHRQHERAGGSLLSKLL